MRFCGNEWPEDCASNVNQFNNEDYLGLKTIK